LTTQEIKTLCEDPNACRLGVTGWYICCVNACKYASWPVYLKDHQTESTCICNGNNQPKVIEIDCAEDDNHCSWNR